MMQRLTDFLAMGGYAVFVWPAYGVTVVVMAGLAVQSLRRYRRGQRALEALQRDRPRRNASGATGS
jgi:heme exporter protein D